MKLAACRVFPPKRRSSLIRAVPGAPNGVAPMEMDVDGVCAFLTDVGPENVITVAPAGPVLAVFFWQEVTDKAPPKGVPVGDEGE